MEVSVNAAASAHIISSVKGLFVVQRVVHSQIGGKPLCIRNKTRPFLP